MEFTEIAWSDANALLRYNWNLFVFLYPLVNRMNFPAEDRELEKYAVVVPELDVFRITGFSFTDKGECRYAILHAASLIVNTLFIDNGRTVAIDPCVHKEWSAAFLHPSENGIRVGL